MASDPPPLCRDLGTKKGAEAAARTITALWAKCGHAVRAWVEPISHDADKTRFCIKSDLVNGLPTKRIER